MVASGDGQYGTAGVTLPNPLQVVVRTVETHIPQKGTNVEWVVTRGDASITGNMTTITDSTGSTSVRVQLGSATGEVEVRASVQSRERLDTTFQLFAVDRPVLDPLTPPTASPGETITLTGSNFSPNAEQNVVLFSGIRGRVSSATGTQLTVEVPSCLPARDVSVTVQLGTVASGAQTLGVGGGGQLLSLQIGEAVDASDAGGFTCFGLPGDGGEQYLTLVYSASTVGAATHAFQLSGLSSVAPALRTVSRRPLPIARPFEVGQGDPQSEWDASLRGLEDRLVTNRVSPSGPGAAPLAAPAPVPSVGERRTFNVFRDVGDFEQVTAVAQYVGAEAAIFVDEQAPAGGYTQTDLQLFAGRFDDVIHPTVTSSFGAASDLDANDRVIVLFTPAVNALTPRGAAGFIGGFFFGLDLLSGQTGSNEGEIFYMIVPDPLGQFSDPRPKASLAGLTPAVLAHEFQHMVHFNQRVLVLDAAGNEALWLSEGLAQYAEELVAREYETGGDPTSVEMFRSGIRDRSRRYLARPDTVSVIVTIGQGSLEERGAGFLSVMYMADRFGGNVIGQLTRSTRTGVANVESATGLAWPDVLVDWWSAVYLDGPGPESGPLVYPEVDLRAFLENPFPLSPVKLEGGDFTVSGSLWSSSAGYYIVNPPAGGSTTVRLGGEGGGMSTTPAQMRMRVIRIS